MKKVLALVLTLVMVLALVACGSKVPEGTYKVTSASGSMSMFKDSTTLEVNSDGSASMIIDFGKGIKDTTKMKFDESSGTVTFDETVAKYSVSENRITFTFDNGNEWIFEK